MDQYRVVLGHWVCKGWYWSVLVILGQNRAILVASVICFQKLYGLQGLSHHIIQYSKKEKVMTYRQTEFPFVDSIHSVEGDELKQNQMA